MSNLIIRQPIFCQYSGIRIGVLEFLTTAGTLPYLTSWNDTVCHHPVFAMQYSRLLKFAKDEWQRLAQLEEPRETETETLRVAYLAILYGMTTIKQDCPGIPPWHIVQNTMAGLFNLAGWKFFLESKRFRFPFLHLSKLNDNLNFENIGNYISACFECKSDYETRVQELVEQEKIRSAEAALQTLRDGWIVPTSKKMLWQWIKAHLPEKYSADAQGWLGTIFLGTDSTIREFEKEDIELACEIIESSCPVGTGIMPAVRERLKKISHAWEQHHEAWEIVEDKPSLFVNGAPILTEHPGEEPKETEHATRGKYLQAHARWQLAMKQWTKENGK